MNPFLNDCKTKMNGLIDEYTTFIIYILRNTHQKAMS